MAKDSSTKKPKKEKARSVQGTPATDTKSTQSEATPDTDKKKKKKGFIQKLFSSSKKGSTAKKSKEGTPNPRASTQQQLVSGEKQHQEGVANSSAVSAPPTPFDESNFGTFRTLTNLSMSPGGALSAGVMEESAVWVEESITIHQQQPTTRGLPASIHSSAEAIELAAKKDAILSKMFPESSSDLRLGDFNPARYLIENNQSTKLADLRALLKYLQVAVARDEQEPAEVQESNLNSLIAVVDALSIVNTEMQHRLSEDDWPMTSALAAKVEETKGAVNDYLREHVQTPTPMEPATGGIDQNRDPARTA